MGPQQLGKILLFTALVLALIGGLLWIFGRAGVNVRLGSLPGDIRLHGEDWSCIVPITTSILLSLLLTILLSVIARFLR